MKKLLLALSVAILTLAQSAYAEIHGDGFSTSEGQHSMLEHQVKGIFFNNSGGALTSGTVVIADTSGSGLNGAEVSGDEAGNSTIDGDASDGNVDNLGSYITTTTTADDERVIGVTVTNSCADQSYCTVVVRGPVRARCADSTDAITAGTTGAVGTTTLAGQAGAGKGLGFALTSGQGTDGSLCAVWVAPGYGT